MRFTVTWTEDARDELAAIWLGSSDRGAITTACDGIDQLLRDDAHLKGAPYHERLVFGIDPITVAYKASQDDRLVVISQVLVTGTN